MVYSFDTEHETENCQYHSKQSKRNENSARLPVVLVADFVLPRSKPTTRQNVLLLEVGQDLAQGTITLETGSGVTVVKATDVGADNFVLWFQQVSVDQTLNAVREQGVMVDRLVRRFRDFKHDRPVWAGLRVRRGWLLAIGQLLGGKFGIVAGLVVRGVVGEDSSTIEGTVIFDKVQLYSR